MDHLGNVLDRHCPCLPGAYISKKKNSINTKKKTKAQRFYDLGSKSHIFALVRQLLILLPLAMRDPYQSPHLNLRTMKSTEATLSPPGYCEPQPARVLWPGGLVTPHLPRPPTTSKTLFARPLHTAPPQNQPHKRGRHQELLRPGKTPSPAAAQPFPPCSARTPANSSGGGAAHKARTSKATQCMDIAGKPGRWTRGHEVGVGGEGGTQGMGVPAESQVRGRGRRAEPRGSARPWPSPSPAAGRARAPLQTRGAGCGKAAATASERITYPSLLRGTGRGRGAPRPVGLSQASSPPCRRRRRRRCRALGPSALLGNNVIPHTLRT